MSVQTILDKIKNGVYGKDVRQAIHDGIEKVYEDAAKSGNANMEVVKARGGYETLDDRFKDFSRVFSGTYDTVVALQTALPKGGDGGLYLVVADGFAYRWNVTSWVKTVQFQSTGLADGTVTADKLAEGAPEKIFAKGMLSQFSNERPINRFPYDGTSVRNLIDNPLPIGDVQKGEYRISSIASNVTYKDGEFLIPVGSHMFTDFYYDSKYTLETNLHVYVHSKTGLPLVGSATASLSIQQTVNNSTVNTTKLQDLGNGWYGITVPINPSVPLTNLTNGDFFTIRFDNRSGTIPVSFDFAYVSDKPMESNQLMNDYILDVLKSENESMDDWLTIGRPDENVVENSLGELTIGELQQKVSTNPYMTLPSTLNAISGEGKITIQPKGYYFYNISPYGTLEVGKTVTSYIHIASGHNRTVQLRHHSGGSNSNDKQFTYQSIGGGWYTATSDPIKSDTNYISLRMDNRDYLEDLVVDKIFASVYPDLSINNMLNDKIQSKGSSSVNSKKYVSLSGKDTNSGDSYSEAYATFQKAITSGVETIIAERGVYYKQSITHSVRDGKLEILPYDTIYNDNFTPTQKIEIRGSDILKDWVSHSDQVWKQTYSGGNKWKEVFVDKTLTPISDSSRPSPNAVLWEGNDRYTDTKLEPVLTLQECLTKEQSFYWDGTTVYIHPKGGTVSGKEFNAVVNPTGIVLSRFNSLKLVDVKCDFVTTSPMQLRYIKHLEAYGCEAGHSTATDGFVLDYSEGVMHQCEGYKNRNDGFNAHQEGDITLYNCKGYNNYDDGISFHEIARGVIYGGEWFGNGKGGIIHVNASKFDIYDAVCYNNHYGIHFSGADGVEQIDIIIKGCVCYNNTDGIYIGTAYNALIENCDLTGNHTNINVTGDGTVDVRNSNLSDGIDAGFYSSSSGNSRLSDSKLSDNFKGIRNPGSGEVLLKRNNIIYNNIGIESSTIVKVDKRNNMYANTTDYSGTQPSTADRAKNVSVPMV